MHCHLQLQKPVILERCFILACDVEQCYWQESRWSTPTSKCPCGKDKSVSFQVGATLDKLEPEPWESLVPKPCSHDVPHKRELEKLERKVVVLLYKKSPLQCSPHAANCLCKLDGRVRSWVTVSSVAINITGLQSVQLGHVGVDSSPSQLQLKEAERKKFSLLATIPALLTAQGCQAQLTKHDFIAKLAVPASSGHQTSWPQV